MAHKHAPGAELMDGVASTLRPWHTFQADTLAKNVYDWRQRRELNVNSVQHSFDEALTDIQRDFPEVTDINLALNMRRWSRQQKKRAERREASNTSHVDVKS